MLAAIESHDRRLGADATTALMRVVPIVRSARLDDERHG
jgi:hypothetical protein